VDGDPARVLAHELQLARVDAHPDGDAELVHGRGHGAATTHRASGPIEDREEAVPGGLDLSAAVHVELLAHEPVVGEQEVPPPRVTQSIKAARGVDDVREQDRSDDPLAWGLQHRGDGPTALPLDGHPRLVADHPGVVPGRDLVDPTRSDVHLLTVVHDHVAHTGDTEAKVMHRAAGAADEGPQVGRPAPTGLEGGMRDHRLVQVERLVAAPRDPPGGSGAAELLHLQPWHADEYAVSEGARTRRTPTLPVEDATQMARSSGYDLAGPTRATRNVRRLLLAAAIAATRLVLRG